MAFAPGTGFKAAMDGIDVARFRVVPCATVRLKVV
jgi:hypothetical protein